MSYSQTSVGVTTQNFTCDSRVLAVEIDGVFETDYEAPQPVAPAEKLPAPAPADSDMAALLKAPVFDITSVVACINNWSDEKEADAAKLKEATDRSRKALYRIIGSGPYAYCVLAAAQDEGKQQLMDKALDFVLHQRGVKSKMSSGRSIKAVKAMFGDQSRSLISAYAHVVDAAIKDSVSPADFPNWLEENGGTEAVRREQKSKGYAQRASDTQEQEKALRSNALMTLTIKDSDKHLFQGTPGSQFALLVTSSDTGELEVCGVVPHDNHILPSLRAACYRVHKELLTREPLPPQTRLVKPAMRSA